MNQNNSSIFLWSAQIVKALSTNGINIWIITLLSVELITLHKINQKYLVMRDFFQVYTNENN